VVVLVENRRTFPPPTSEPPKFAPTSLALPSSEVSPTATILYQEDITNVRDML
jgi:hypothetical protein